MVFFYFVSESLVLVRFRLLSCVPPTFVSFADNAQCEVFVPKCTVYIYIVQKHDPCLDTERCI